VAAVARRKEAAVRAWNRGETVMPLLAKVLVGLVAVLHLYFPALEMFL
jgi:hypothetical protein